MTRSRWREAARFATVLTLLCAMAPSSGYAEIEGRRVRLGVLNDQSGQYSDSGGQGSVLAAQIAADEMRLRLPGTTIEIVSADHQNKADVGSAIARRWFANEAVDAILDVPVSSVALAVQEISRQSGKILLNQATTSDLSGRACSPVSTQWGIDTQAMSVGPVRAVARTGASRWFFLSADYAFGQALTRDATAAIDASGGKVLGTLAAPLGTTDFSSQLLTAQSSGAQVLGLANAGQDLINTIKQAHEFGINKAGMSMVAFLMFITDIHSLGLEQGQGLLVTDSFYWDRNDDTRAFSKRFFDRFSRMPSTEQTLVYVSAKHYLSGVAASNDKDSATIMKWMKSNKVEFFGKTASVRSDGRVVYNLDLYRVKSPAESKKPWDYYEHIAEISNTAAFGETSSAECRLGQN